MNPACLGGFWPDLRQAACSEPGAAMPMPLASGAAALIQLRGPALHPGAMAGSAGVRLERARGGDTPVLTFVVDAPAGTVRLLLDTGAAAMLVTPALLQRLGLIPRPVAPGSFGLAGAGEGCRGLQPQRIRLPALRLRDSEGLGGPALRLSGAEALMLPVAGLPADVDGVLGAPQLRQLPVWIDPRSDRLALGGKALEAQAPEAAATLRLRWRRGVPLLPLALDRPRAAGSPVTTLVPALADTGAEGLFVTPALAATLKALAPGRPLQVAGSCGQQPARATQVLGPHLPGTGPAAPVQAIETANPVFRALGVEAIVGQELLRSHRQLWRLDTNPPRLTLW
ncbi:MAG: hypothetical protein ER33_15365 [Cyanobium sp. CACIAM 14]|nr:MAG: hypothetical protein ER33_15365 [Cyanobium sp. CACIAM 14]